MYKVVIIDDEKIIRDGLRKIVPWQSLGCEIVAEASNGIYGIELIRKVQPDIILTDIRMPGVDGLTMLEETLDVAGNAKVIIITGYRDFDYAQKAIRLGAFDFLVKPTDIDRLISSIKAIVKELDKIADKSNYLNEDIISEYNKSSKLVNINIVLSKLTDSVCMGNMEESSVCYDEYRKVCMDSFSSKQLRMAAIYQLIMELNNLRPNVKLEPYSDFSGLNSLMTKCKDVDELYDVIWLAVKKIVDEYNSSDDGTKSLAVRRMKEYIVKNYDKPIGLNEIANVAFISTYYASKIFKQETGINLIEYLNYYRIEQAKRLLRDPQYKVYQIAEMVGISDSHYFSRLFKKHTNYTPRAYREMSVSVYDEE